MDGSEFDVSKRTIAATKLNEGDAVIGIAPSSDISHVVIQSHNGYFLKFACTDIPEKKKGAVGVRVMKLSEDDFGEMLYFLKNGTEQLIAYKDKELSLNKLKLAKRDTKGTKVRV